MWSQVSLSLCFSSSMSRFCDCCCLQVLPSDDVDMKVLPPTDGMLLQVVSRLHIWPVQDSHAGRYQCVATNQLGSTYSTRAIVTVNGMRVVTLGCWLNNGSCGIDLFRFSFGKTSDFLPISRFISEMMQDRAIVTVMNGLGQADKPMSTLSAISYQVIHCCPH